MGPPDKLTPKDSPRNQPPPIPGPVEPLGARDPRPADKTLPPSSEKPTPPSPGGPKKVVKTLPGTVSNAAVGGGGRYLILHLARERKLAIFDLKEARIARYITLTADNIKFTAGQDKIVVVLTDTNVVQRWDIASGERDLSIPLAGKGKVKFVSMGSASDGPILVGFEDGFKSNLLFADLKTLRPLPYRMSGHGAASYKDCYVRASADGKVFGLWTPHSSPSGISTLVIAGKEVRAFYEHDSAGHITPDAEGKTICTGRGLWTTEAKRLAKTRDDTYYIPAVQPGYYLSIRFPDIARRTTDKSTLSLFLSGSEQPLATLPQIALPSGINSWDREAFGFDRHILFIPEAQVFVVVPETNDKLVLYRYDIVAALEQSGVDYLIVASQPPRTVKPNAEYTYQVRARSKKGGVKYRLDAGPTGMTIGPDGLVKWKAPPNPKKENEVIISVSDASGQERFHSFTLRVRSR